MHQLGYSQLAQHRENSTSAVSIYSPPASRTVQGFLKLCNLTDDAVYVSVFHDSNGTTYDQTTAIIYNMILYGGQLLEVDHIFLDDSTGNLAYSSSVANAINATLYGVVR